MHLLLIRHGETDWNYVGRLQGHTDTPLNDRGIEQARILAARLAAEEKIDTLYASPLLRARVTAEIIGARFQLRPLLDERLVERSAGHLEGLTAVEVKERFPDFFKAWRGPRDRPLALPGGESAAAFEERVRSFLQAIRPRHGNESVAVVTHGGTLAIMIEMLLGLNLQHRLPFRFDNTALNILDLTDGHACLKLLNDTFHLSNGYAQKLDTGNDDSRSADVGLLPGGHPLRELRERGQAFTSTKE